MDDLVNDLRRMSEMNSMSLWKRDVCKRAADALSIPAVDAVEVVRCRDCKCYPKDFDEDSWNWCCGFGDDTNPNDFCSYGKRREDGTDA